MGLKTTTYEVKSMKETLDTAYAYIRKIKVDEYGNGVATIAVHRTRELAKDPTVKPYEIKEIEFKCNRNANDRITAYEKAKGQREERQWNVKTHKIETVLVGEAFYGWTDDIVVGEYVERYI